MAPDSSALRPGQDKWNHNPHHAFSSSPALSGFLLQAFLIGNLCQGLNRISMTDKIAQRITHHIRNLHTKRILIDEGSIAQPIMDGILLFARLHNESTV